MKIGEADELYKKIAHSIERDEEEVMEVIHSIRRKMLQKQMVREHKKGEYSFTKEYEADLEDYDFSIEDSTAGMNNPDDFDM